jgi:hypothetical protein
LTYGLGLDFLMNNPDLDKLPIEEYSKRVRQNGGYLAQAHPYRSKTNKMLYPIDPHLLDGLEVFNAARFYKGHDRENESAAVYANFHKLPMQAGSDSHKDERPFYSGVELEQKAANVHDIIDAIKQRRVKLVLPAGYKMPAADNTDAGGADMMIQIFSDCHNAQTAVEGLRNYLAGNRGLDVRIADMDDERKEDLMVRNTKKIIIGHHSSFKSRMRSIGAKYDRFGMKYGFDGHLCVLQASKSELKESAADWHQFDTEYFRKYEKFPESDHLRKSQFEFLVDEFIENGLDGFLREG